MSGDPVVLLATTKDPNGKLTVLSVDSDGQTAVRVNKVALTRTAAEALRRERSALQSIRTHLTALEDTIPQILQTFEGDRALVMSGLPGEPLTRRYHQWRHTRQPSRVRADFEAVGRWLAQMQALPTGPPAPVTMLAGVADVLSHRFRGWSQCDSALAGVAEVERRLQLAHTPRTVVHGDFWAGNVLLNNGVVSGVVDWEFSQLVGEPIHDIARFALTYSLYLDRHTKHGTRVRGHPGLRADRWGAGIRYAIHGEGWYPTLVHGFLRDGLSRLGAHALDVSDVLLAELATIAAESDDDDFALAHIQLFTTLADERP
jgi:aminoglycoside phosphotransferase (APT) family kinase protein